MHYNVFYSMGDIGHVCVIISGGEGGAEDKLNALRSAGCHIAESPTDLGSTMGKALGLYSSLSSST